MKPVAAVLKQGGGRTEVGEGELSARLGAAGSVKRAHLVVRQGGGGGSARRGAGSC